MKCAATLTLRVEFRLPVRGEVRFQVKPLNEDFTGWRLPDQIDRRHSTHSRGIHAEFSKRVHQRRPVSSFIFVRQVAVRSDYRPQIISKRHVYRRTVIDSANAHSK